jgi:hypothetical protein
LPQAPDTPPKKGGLCGNGAGKTLMFRPLSNLKKKNAKKRYFFFSNCAVRRTRFLKKSKKDDDKKCRLFWIFLKPVLVPLISIQTPPEKSHGKKKVSLYIFGLVCNVDYTAVCALQFFLQNNASALPGWVLPHPLLQEKLQRHNRFLFILVPSRSNSLRFLATLRGCF